MNTQHRQILQDYRQSGVSLLEVLISIVVLTVGLLGTAHMQTTGLVNNQRAYQRSQATLLAYDIADRMRANSASINNYLTSYMELEDAEAQENCKSTESCTSANMAENDLFEWNVALATDLRGVNGLITLSGETYMISIAWDDNNDGATDDTDPNFQVSFKL